LDLHKLDDNPLYFQFEMRWSAGEQRSVATVHAPHDRGRIVPPSLQALQEPILLLHWVCFRGGGFLTRGFWFSAAPVESSRASPYYMPREDGLAHPADSSRSNPANALGVLSRRRLSKPNTKRMEERSCEHPPSAGGVCAYLVGRLRVARHVVRSCTRRQAHYDRLLEKRTESGRCQVGFA
jgi:hypothetical protein